MKEIIKEKDAKIVIALGYAWLMIAGIGIGLSVLGFNYTSTIVKEVMVLLTAVVAIIYIVIFAKNAYGKISARQ